MIFLLFNQTEFTSESWKEQKEPPGFFNCCWLKWSWRRSEPKVVCSSGANDVTVRSCCLLSCCLTTICLLNANLIITSTFVVETIATVADITTNRYFIQFSMSWNEGCIRMRRRRRRRRRRRKLNMLWRERETRREMRDWMSLKIEYMALSSFASNRHQDDHRLLSWWSVSPGLLSVPSWPQMEEGIWSLCHDKCVWLVLTNFFHYARAATGCFVAEKMIGVQEKMSGKQNEQTATSRRALGKRSRFFFADFFLVNWLNAKWECRILAPFRSCFGSPSGRRCSGHTQSRGSLLIWWLPTLLKKYMRGKINTHEDPGEREGQGIRGREDQMKPTADGNPRGRWKRRQEENRKSHSADDSSCILHSMSH